MRDKVETIESINRAMDRAFFKCENGLYKPFVCVVCDRILQRSEVTYIKKDVLANMRDILSPKRLLHDDVVEYYQVDEAQREGLNGMLLSPSACFIDPRKQGGKFVCCVACLKSLVKDSATPEFAIANYLEIGTIPTELRELTDIEFAFISDVKCHSHVITYKGGYKGMKGWHSLLKTNIKDKRYALESARRLDGVIPNKLVIIMSGEMTSKQKHYVTQRCEIRRDKCAAAIDWLCKNHAYYSSEYGEIILENIKDPIIIDETSEIPSRDSNIEMHQDFRITFPDGTITTLTGGYTSVDEFKAAFIELGKGQVEGTLNVPDSEYVRDFEGMNFMLAFLKQYPYGYGGLHEVRDMINGSRRKSYKEDYIRHVTLLSNPCFSESLFTLVCYNIICRHLMLKSASWRVRSNDSREIAGLTTNNFSSLFVDYRNRERSDRIDEAAKFLRLVDSVCSSLPHSPRAAKDALKDVMSMQCSFGFPHIFFTVSPPDGNSVIISIYSGQEIEVLPENITEEYLKRRCKERAELAYKFPGLSCFNFQVILDIVISEVIGWRKEGGGYFGKPRAYFGGIEEQSRKSLHVHFLIWLDNDPLNLEGIHESRPNGKMRNKIIADAVNYIDQTQSCLIHGDDVRHAERACKSGRHRNGRNHQKCNISVHNDQILRFIRHQDAGQEYEGVIACCERCKKTWTSSELAFSKIDNIMDVEPDQLRPQTRRQEERLQKLKAEEILFRSKCPGDAGEVDIDVSNVLYNNHSSLHVKTCFDEKRHECRYRFPRKSNKRTRVIESEDEYEWYDFQGGIKKRRLLDVELKRGIYDVCSNTYCPVLSESKLSCNSNVASLSNGHSAFYTCKYACKSTEKDDGRDFTEAAQFLERQSANVNFESTDSEALSRMIGACMAHNNKNIISAPMARYLIHHSSRFKISHNFAFIPMHDLSKMLYDENLELRLKLQETANKKKTYIAEVSAMNYVFRPEKLEKLSVLEFYFHYLVISKEKCMGKKEELFKLKSEHPSADYNVVKLRKDLRLIPGIVNWRLIDSATLKGDIMDKKTQITKIEEDYAEQILILCCPYRNLSDLKINGSFVEKYRFVFNKHIMKHRSILQNIQNIRNSVRYRTTKDSLEMSTERYVSPFGVNTRKDQENGDDEMNDETRNEEMNAAELAFIQELITSEAMEKSDGINDDLRSISFSEIRNRGAHKSGYIGLHPPELAVNSDEEDNSTVRNSQAPTFREAFYEYAVGEKRHLSENDMRNEDEEGNHALQTKITAKMLLSVLLRHTIRMTGANKNEQNDFNIQETENLPEDQNEYTQKQEATGTARSIIQWSKAVKVVNGERQCLDDGQRCAFMVMIASFIITFIDDSEETIDYDVTSAEAVSLCHKIMQEKTLLQQIGGNRNRLRLFLNGPGGSGKSEVISEVLTYAEAFCYNLNVPFTKYTVLVTASTGVAATLIRGNTTHRSCLLEKNVTADDVKLFQTVRLVIVDEISMLPYPALKKLDSQLRALGCDAISSYGDKNIVFAGDFMQLEPIPDTTAIYKHEGSKEWHLSVNTYIELRGRYRFLKDPEWGALLQRFHDGNATPADFTLINTRVIRGDGNFARDGSKVPSGIRYATYRNKERDAINAGIFLERAKKDSSDCMLIFSSDLQLKPQHKSEKYVPLLNPKSFYETTGESDCKLPPRSSAKFDPVLKVFKNCEVMLFANDDVGAGIANGSEAQMEKIFLKPGVQTFLVEVEPGVTVKAVFANQVERIRLRHKNRKIDKRIFYLEPRQQSFLATLTPPDSLTERNARRITKKVRGVQIPVSSNAATTGHKLQGSSRDFLFVNSWAYKTNWPYVVLSRVCEKRGLFLRHELRPHENMQMPIALRVMEEHFFATKSLPDGYLAAIDLIC